MKKTDDSEKNPLSSTKLSSTKPSPDNQGIELDNPENVDEAAAEANRDIDALQKKDPKKKIKHGKIAKATK